MASETSPRSQRSADFIPQQGTRREANPGHDEQPLAAVKDQGFATAPLDCPGSASERLERGQRRALGSSGTARPDAACDSAASDNSESVPGPATSSSGGFRGKGTRVNSPAFRSRPAASDRYVVFEDEHLAVFVRKSVLSVIVYQSRQAAPYETIGRLLGRPFVDERGDWAVIELASHAKAARSTKVHVQSEIEDECRVAEILEGNLSLERMGWWHSHPYLSLPSYSGTDQYNQELTCPAATQVGALVCLDRTGRGEDVAVVHMFAGPRSRRLRGTYRQGRKQPGTTEPSESDSPETVRDVSAAPSAAPNRFAVRRPEGSLAARMRAAEAQEIEPVLDRVSIWLLGMIIVAACMLLADMSGPGIASPVEDRLFPRTTNPARSGSRTSSERPLAERRHAAR